MDSARREKKLVQLAKQNTPTRGIWIKTRKTSRWREERLKN